VQVSAPSYAGSEVGANFGSYNKINGTWACENGGIINKLLKDELGFRGYMMTDWNGRYPTN